MDNLELREKIRRLRLTKTEDELVERMAKIKGLNVSEFLRYLIRKEENEMNKKF